MDRPGYVDRAGRYVIVDEFILTRIRIHAAEFARGKRDARARASSFARGHGVMILNEHDSARSGAIMLEYLRRVVAPQPRDTEREDQQTFAESLAQPPHDLRSKQARAVADELFSVYAQRINDLGERLALAGCEVDFNTACELVAAYDHARSFAERAFARVDQSMLREYFAMWTHGQQDPPSTQVLKTAIEKFESPAKSRFVDGEAVRESLADVLCEALQYLPRSQRGRVDPSNASRFKERAREVAGSLLSVRRVGVTVGQLIAGISAPGLDDNIETVMAMSTTITETALEELRPHAGLIKRKVPDGDVRIIGMGSEWRTNLGYALTRGLQDRHASALLDIAGQWCPLLSWDLPERVRFSSNGIHLLPDAPEHVIPRGFHD